MYNKHSHIFFGKQFQETRRTPTAGLQLAVGMHLVKQLWYLLHETGLAKLMESILTITIIQKCHT